MNEQGVRELLMSGGVRSALSPIADRGADQAEAGAPHDVGGTIVRESVTTGPGGIDPHRAVERFGTSHEAGLLIEANSGFLARALAGAT
jgi:hypothetical protein